MQSKYKIPMENKYFTGLILFSGKPVAAVMACLDNGLNWISAAKRKS